MGEAFKGKKFISPTGRAGFVALSEPFDDDKGPMFKCDLHFEGAEAKKAEKFVKTLTAADKKDRGKAPKSPGFWELDDDEEKTGTYIIRFKASAGGTVKKGKRKGKTWVRNIQIAQPEEGTIGAGSVLAIQFEVFQTTYQGKNFLQLQPLRVRVDELVIPEGLDDDDDEGFFDGIDEATINATSFVPDVDDSDDSDDSDEDSDDGEGDDDENF